jgi:hypothetical protein
LTVSTCSRYYSDPDPVVNLVGMIKESDELFICTRAYFISRIEPARFPMAKREPSQTQADTAPKSGCLDHEEPIGKVGTVPW